MVLVQSLQISKQWFLQKLEIEIPQEQALQLLGLYPKGSQSHHNAMLNYVHNGIIDNSQNMKINQIPSQPKKSKNNVVYLHNGVLLRRK